MAKLDRKLIDDGCEVAYRRYAEMPFDQACLKFSFEVQGWAKWMIRDHGGDLDHVRERINVLLDMLAKANDR
jgi:hypothetical protein